MSETKNYNLFLTDNDQMKFYEWREKMSGENDSNMIKIDTALGEKADLSVKTDDVLTVSGWSTEAPYTQTLLIEGLAENQNGVIGIAQNITSEQMEVVCAAQLCVSGQTDGSLTITVNGEKPTCDIPVSVILFG